MMPLFFSTLLLLAFSSLALSQSDDQSQANALAEPITKEALEADKKKPTEIDIAKPKSLSDVVTEPVFEPHEREEGVVDHIDDDSEQDLQAIINAKPIVKPAKPNGDELAKPETLEAEKQPVNIGKDESLIKKIQKIVSKNDLMIQQPKLPEALIMLETAIPPGTATRLAWMPDQSFKGIAAPTPVLVVNGAKPGPKVCLTAAIHGDELNGIEIVRRVLYQLEPQKLSGAVIGVPIVNLQGFHRHSRYLTDRRDLNRFFPGDPKGSSASRLAYSFFNEVIRHCDALIDLHTGSFYRTNMPQLRVNTDNPEVLDLAKQFGATVIVHGEGALGTLRRAAVDEGIPAVTLEAGESMRLQELAVDHGVKGIKTLFEQKNMLSSLKFWKKTEAIYKQSLWVRADQGGILFSKVDQGAHVNKGDILGVVTDPITNMSSDIIAPVKGRVIGLALNQVVMPGFATFHLGIEAANVINTEVDITPEPVEESVEDFN